MRSLCRVNVGGIFWFGSRGGGRSIYARGMDLNATPKATAHVSCAITASRSAHELSSESEYLSVCPPSDYILHP